MSTVIEDTTGAMAQRLLAGWTLSDQICPVEDCNVPLLTKNEERYCARCSQADTNGHATTHLDSDASSTSALSVETPPTPTSTIADLAPPPPRISEAARDAAAREIGNLLLKGWCLLGDECPQCPGIPLMSRPRPRSTPQVDAGPSTGRRGASAPAASTAAPPGKLCVNCRSEFMPPGSLPGAVEPMVATGGAAARKRARMEETRAQASGSARKGKAPAIARNVNDSPATSEPLQALETAMAVLTKQLEAAMGSVPLNVLAVAEAAEAIGKTARAISDVRALQ